MKLSQNLNDFFFVKTKKSKIVSSSISIIFVIYAGLIVYPNLLFAHSLKYKNFNIYSTQPPGDNVQIVLDEAEKKLLASEIYDKS